MSLDTAPAKHPEAVSENFSPEALEACQAKTWQLVHALKEKIPNDIFFLDLGPIYDGYEGDCGQTFTLGSMPEAEKMIAVGEDIFKSVSARFKNTGESGAELYVLRRYTAMN